MALPMVLGGAAQAATCEGSASGTQLTVRVTGVPVAKGEMAITLYPDSSKRFLAPGGKLLRVRPAATAPVSTACFNLPAPGYYAVAVYHDVDGDSDFDRSRIGMPLEDFGFSNDAPTPIGLPSFKAARFHAGAGETVLNIKLRRQR